MKVHPVFDSHADLSVLSVHVAVASHFGSVTAAVNLHPAVGSHAPLLTWQLGTVHALFSYVQPAAWQAAESSEDLHFAAHEAGVFSAAALNEQPLVDTHPLLSPFNSHVTDALHVASVPAVHLHDPVHVSFVVLDVQSSAHVINIIKYKTIIARFAILSSYRIKFYFFSNCICFILCRFNSN